MIARTWRGRAPVERADAYHRHFTTEVVPNLNSVPGHRGAYLLRREVEGEVEFVAVTLWDSIETIKGFAGADPSRAHIEPAGLAALSSFDDFANNYDIVCSTVD